MAKENFIEEEDFSIFENMADQFGTVEEPAKETPPEGQPEEIEEPEDPEVNDDDEGDQNDPEVSDEQEEPEDVSFTPYAKFLHEQGILSQLDLESFDGTAEGLKAGMESEIKYHVDNYINTLPEELHNLVRGVKEGIPYEEMIKVTSAKLEYNTISEEQLETSVTTQKEIVKKFLDETTQFSNEMKEKWISNLEDSAQLEGEAKSALTSLKEIQLKKEQQALIDKQNQEKQYAQEIERIQREFKETVEKTDEVIPGVKVTPIMRNKIVENLTKPAGYDQNGNPVNKIGKYMGENPIKGEIILNYIFEATNGFSDFGVFTKTGRSQALKELEDAARAADSRGGGAGKRRPKSTGSDGLIDAVRQFNQAKF